MVSSVKLGKLIKSTIMARKSTNDQLRTTRSRVRARTCVMVFGVFDELHPGHIHFLGSARARGDILIIVLARDASVKELKGRTPRNAQKERTTRLRDLRAADKVVLGDRLPGTYEVIRKHRPHLIALGYDQHALAADLRRKRRSGTLPQFKLIRLGAYGPDRYHSSLIGRKERAARISKT